MPGHPLDKDVEMIPHKHSLKLFSAVLAAFMALLVGSMAYAADSGVPSLGLMDCITKAKETTPRLDAIKDQSSWEQTKVDTSFRRFFPEMNIDLSHHPKLDYFGRPIEEADIYSTEFTLTQPLYTGGKLTNQRAQAKEGLKKVPLEKRKIELEVALDVIPSYYQAISFKEQAEQRSTLLDMARQQVKEAQEGVERGVLLREDMLDAKARLAELEYEATLAQSKAREALYRLKELMGIDRAMALELKPQLPTFKIPENSDAILKMAMKNNPSLVFSRAERSYRDLGLKLARSKDSSRFNLVGSFAFEGDEFPGDEKNYVVGLVWEMPFGDNTFKAYYKGERQFENEYALYYKNQSFQRKGISVSLLDGNSQAESIAENAYMLSKAQGELSENVRQLRIRILQLMEELKRQNELGALAEEQTKLNQERVQVARSLEKLGRTPPEEVLKRQQDLARSTAKSLDARYEKARIQATLCLLAGDKLCFN